MKYKLFTTLSCSTNNTDYPAVFSAQLDSCSPYHMKFFIINDVNKSIELSNGIYDYLDEVIRVLKYSNFKEGDEVTVLSYNDNVVRIIRKVEEEVLPGKSLSEKSDGWAEVINLDGNDRFKTISFEIEKLFRKGISIKSSFHLKDSVKELDMLTCIAEEQEKERIEMIKAHNKKSMSA